MRRLRSLGKCPSTTGRVSEDLTDSPVSSRVKGLELDLRRREFEINQLTQRNNFFMIFQGVLIAGLVQSQGTSAPIITFSMSILGMATSAFQIGMAGGAKYWQSRWEASTRSSEIAIVLELVKQKKLAVQTFTHDSSVLTAFEREQIKEWNAEHSNPEDQIADDPDYIQSIVMADVSAVRKNAIRRSIDWWVRKLAIEPKWSVSRIPIWIGGVLFVFWSVIALNTVHVPGLKLSMFDGWPVTLVPLKMDVAE